MPRFDGARGELDGEQELRFEELHAKGSTATYEETLKEQKERDLRDSSRDVAPLKQADDAELVDTSRLTFDEVVAHLESIARRRLSL